MILGVGLLCLVLFSPSIQGLENSTVDPRCGDSRLCGCVHFDYMENSAPPGLTRLVININSLCQSDFDVWLNGWNGIERSLKPTREGLTHYESNITKAPELGST